MEGITGLIICFSIIIPFYSFIVFEMFNEDDNLDI